MAVMRRMMAVGLIPALGRWCVVSARSWAHSVVNGSPQSHGEFPSKAPGLKDSLNGGIGPMRRFPATLNPWPVSTLKFVRFAKFNGITYVSLLLLRSSHDKFAKFPINGGMIPESELLPRVRLVSFGHMVPDPLKGCGMGPLRLLPCSRRSVSFKLRQRFQMVAGIIPVNWLCSRETIVRLGLFPSSPGMAPVSLLWPRTNSLSSYSCEMAELRVPDRPAESRTKLVTTAPRSVA